MLGPCIHYIVIMRAGWEDSEVDVPFGLGMVWLAVDVFEKAHELVGVHPGKRLIVVVIATKVTRTVKISRSKQADSLRIATS